MHNEINEVVNLDLIKKKKWWIKKGYGNGVGAVTQPVTE